MQLPDRNQAFYRFTDNLEHRGDSDLIINMLPVFIVIFMPVLLCMLLFVGPSLCESLFGKFSYLGTDEVMVEVFIAFESFVIAIVISRMYKRLWSHAKRDNEWRRALVDYAAAGGHDVTALKQLDTQGRKIGRFYGRIPAAFIVVLMYLFIILYYFYVMPKGDMNTFDYTFIIGVGLVFVLFFFVFIKVLTFPYKHEMNQSEFMSEFSRVTGLKVPVMEITVKHHHFLVHLLLTVVTLGLYLFVLLYEVFKSMNDHLKNQWVYEDKLLVILGRQAGAVLGDGGKTEPTNINGVRKMPLTLVFAEIFMIFMIATYMLKMVGIALDISEYRQLYDITMLPETLAMLNAEEQFRIILKYVMVVWNVVFIGITIEAMMALVSGRTTAWRNVVRSCLTFTIPTWISYYLYSPESYTHLFDLDPYVTTAVLYVLLLFMFISVDVKRFYTPTTMSVPKTSDWLRFAVHGELGSRE